MSAASTAAQQQAAAHLQHYFHQQVAEAMPRAFELAQRDGFALSRWLVNATMRVQPTVLPVLASTPSAAFLADFGVPTLLVLLFDQRQTPAVSAAARDALTSKYLADEDTQASIIGSAQRMARQAVQALQLEQAEHQALFGRVVAGSRAAETAEG